MEIAYFVLNSENGNSFRMRLIENIFKNFTLSQTCISKDVFEREKAFSVSIFDNVGNISVSSDLINKISIFESPIKILLVDDDTKGFSDIIAGNRCGSLFVLTSRDMISLSHIINMVDINGIERFNNNLQDLNHKKRVLLISPKGWQKVSVNLGLALLAGALKSAGFETLILDLCYDELSDEDVMKKAGEFGPFIIGLSVKTSQAKEAFRVAELLKKTCPEAVIVAGGPHVTLDPDFFFLYQKNVFDYCIMSEGEEAFTSLSIALTMDRTDLAEKLGGIVYENQQRCEVVVNKWAPPSDLSVLPYPDFDSIYNFKTDNFCYPIVSSRGCPYSCIYCCVNLLTGSKKWRCRTPENIVDEIVNAKEKYNISQFEFWDDNFTLDMDRAKTFCRLLIDTGLSLSWWCHNGIRADKLDDELATLMFKAGCTSVALGIESGTPEIFNSIKKGEVLNDCVNAVKVLKNAGIKAVGYFIIGLPGDSLKTFIETVRFQRRLELDHYTFGLLVPYPGTEVWDIVENEGEFLVDVTDSQHFSSELPTISFELPNFPRHDIIVAYYLTRFYELFELVENLVNEKNPCNVSFFIEQLDGVRGATALFYSLYLLKDNIKISLVTDMDESSFQANKDFITISDLFDYSISNIEGKPLNKTDVVVASKKFADKIKGLPDQETIVFFLELSNPIKALDKQ